MASRRSPALLIAATLIAFLAVVAVRSRPANPETRLPGRYKLADLIEQQQTSAAKLRKEVASLRTQVASERADAERRSGGTQQQADAVAGVSTMAGLSAVEGPGLRVTLSDSKLDQPPAGGNVNDLVIHSQDVQAVVNGLWRAGAEAMAINGQRVVSTSAILCVGNTLLLNGTVSSPPYVVSAVGASKDRFDGDRLIRRLKSDASAFGLTFSVDRPSSVQIPAYSGSTRLNYAKPAR